MEIQEYISSLVERARKAQAIAATYTQEQVRDIAASIAWMTIQRADYWAEFYTKEVGKGNPQSKIDRNKTRARGLTRDYKNAKTVGIIDVDEAMQIVKIAKPVGVVASLVPMTVPMGVTFIGAMNAIMGRNATICAPHPQTKQSTMLAVADIRTLFGKLGIPEDLIQCVEDITMDKSRELMKQCDLVVATGGAPMVKAAYSSGTPAYGVGAGNVVVTIDESADLGDAAKKVAAAQLNDYAAGCSTENAVVIAAGIYDKTLKAMQDNGAYLCTPEDKVKLQGALWVDGHLNQKAIITPAENIAKLAGIDLPAGKTWFLVEETGFGKEYPFSGEKLSVVVTAFKYDNTIEDAISIVNRIHAYSGAGHSCGIHSKNDDDILTYALGTNTTRVAVNMTVGIANAGAWNNGMPWTINLGCGTWGGNIVSENITYKHYINTTWVAREIKEFTIPTDEYLFGELMNNKERFDWLK